MYSVVCRKVHECRFTLAQLQRSIQRARNRLDHERVEIPPVIVDQLLSEREQNDHRGRESTSQNSFYSLSLAPFVPKQPNAILKSGDIYLKSIDQSHRRTYDKYVTNDNSEGDTNHSKTIVELYVRFL